MKEKIILIGGGGHCKACIDVIEQEGKYSVAGIVNKHKKKGIPLLGYLHMGTDDDLFELCKRFSWFLITVGQIKSSKLRFDLFKKIEKFGGNLPIVVSPLAYISPHAKLGQGTVVMHRSVVNAGAWVGDNCIINTGVIIEHDAILGSHIHVSTGAILNGGVTVGDHTFIGSRVVIREGVTLGENVIIAAGTSVFKDIPSGTLVKGCFK